MTTIAFIVHNKTKEQGLIKSVTPAGYNVQWLNSGGLAHVNAADITVVAVPCAPVRLFGRKLEPHVIVMLENTFATLTPEGWIIPIWIDRLRP